jgi:hypothetical protein
MKSHGLTERLYRVVEQVAGPMVMVTWSPAADSLA